MPEVFDELFIRKIFNNNVILSKNDNNKEIVLMGCGLAFGKRVGDEVDKSKIEKIFILESNDVLEKFKLLLEDVPMEHVSLSHDIIEYAKNILGDELNDYIYITLTDHISYAIKQCAKNVNKPNKLIGEIKKFYTKEFEIGLKALEFIEDETGYKMHEDEAGNIALHLINAQLSKDTDTVEDIYNITKKIEDILNIVKYTYNIELSI